MEYVSPGSQSQEEKFGTERPEENRVELVQKMKMEFRLGPLYLRNQSK